MSQEIAKRAAVTVALKKFQIEGEAEVTPINVLGVPGYSFTVGSLSGLLKIEYNSAFVYVREQLPDKKVRVRGFKVDQFGQLTDLD